MNRRRGRESRLHTEAKTNIGRFFEHPCWTVFYEQRNADVLVLHHASLFVAAIEAESGPRNVQNNIRRNRIYGCKAVAVVSLSERCYVQVASKVHRYQTEDPKFPLKLFPYTTAGICALHAWILSLAENTTSPQEPQS